MKKRCLNLLCIATALMLVLTSCSKPAAPAPSAGGDSPASGQQQAGGETISAKDTFVYGLGAEPGTLDGLLANDFNAYILTHNIYDTLIFEETDGTLSPCLAETWEVSEAGDEVIFHLRQGVKFHDGSDFTAEDVKFTFDKDIANPAAASLTSSMDHMEIIDDYTVKLVMKNPYGPVLNCVTGSQLVIVSKSAYEANPDGYARAPIGTGPYKFVEWVGGDKITLTRFDDYWGEKGHIKDATFKIIADSSTAAVALETGEVDMIGPAAADRDNLMSNPDIAYYEIEQLSSVFVAMNNKRGLFSDKNMRLAMAYGIDREAVLQGAEDGVGVVNDVPMAKVFGWPEDFQWYDYDPEKAKEYLATAGYPDGLTITFTTMASNSYIAPTEVIQDQLRKIGVTVEVEKIERAAFIEKVVSNKDYEIAVMSATAFIPDSDYLYAQYHSDPTEKGRNYHLNENPELDRLLEEARAEQDPVKRQELYEQCCQIFKDEAIQVPLYIGMTSQAANAKLMGYEISPMRRIYLKYYYWVE